MTWLRTLWSWTGAFLLPQDCALCGAWVCNQEWTPLCPACRIRIRPLHGPLCTLCGDSVPGPLSRSDALCGRCQESPPAFDRCRAWGFYAGSMRNLIRRYKYAGYRRLSSPLAEFLCLAYRRYAMPHPNFVAPVPSHRVRVGERGFDPVQSIARRFSGRLNVPFLQAAQRTRNTRPQFGLDVEARRKNLRAAFQARPNADLEGAHILIVDDILTTGTTASELARTLKEEAGVKQVSVLVVARATRYFGG